MRLAVSVSVICFVAVVTAGCASSSRSAQPVGGGRTTTQVATQSPTAGQPGSATKSVAVGGIRVHVRR